jgi:hypothetical protein
MYVIIAPPLCGREHCVKHKDVLRVPKVALKKSKSLKIVPYGGAAVPMCQSCTWQQDCAFAEVALAADIHNRKIHFTEYGAGQHLIDEGEPTMGMRVLCRGVAVTSVLDENGRDNPVHLHCLGGVLDAAVCHP